MHTNERREAILRVICNRGNDTVENLASEFGVSSRTVQRDIEMLSLYHPIYTKTGRYGGGVYVVEGYKYDKACLNNAEEALMRKIIAYAEDHDDMLNVEEMEELKKFVLSHSNYTLKEKRNEK